jgi:hypothetical protein
MTWRPAGLAVVLSLTATAPTWAAPPKINNISPFGVQRGAPTEVAISGGSVDGNPRLIAPFKFTLGPAPATKSDGGNWRLTLVVDPSTAVGVYPVRVQTDDGLSNPFLFSVGQLPQVTEKEDNSTFETAQAISSTPVVIEGTTAGNDVDFFRFAGKKGQQIVVDAQCNRIGSGIDPTIRLTTASHTYVASADDSPGLLTDARLTAVLPEDTDYVVELSDTRYQGAGRPVYRLVVGAVPIAEEIYPIGARRGETVGLELRGGTLHDTRIAASTVTAPISVPLFRVRTTSQALGLTQAGEPNLDVESLTPLTVTSLTEIREATDPAGPPAHAAAPVVLNGRIDPAGDEDDFTLTVTPGQRLHFQVEASEVGSALDGVLQLLGAKGAVLATADDANIPVKTNQPNVPPNVSPDPRTDFTVPSGLTELTVRIRDLERRGGVGFPYRIVVTPANPGFELALNDSEVSVPKGGTASVGVTIVRKGYNGPISLSVANPPTGLSFRPGTIAAGQLLGVFSVSASADAGFGATNLRVIGTGDGSVAEDAEKSLVFAQQGTLPTSAVVQHGLEAAPALPQPVTLDAPANPVEVAHGFGASVALKVVRAKDADTALAVTPLPLPPGLAVPAANIAAKAVEGKVPVNAAVETPLGLVTIGLVAKGKVANADHTFAVPAITLNVVRPAAAQLATASLEVKAGATFELKGKVVRKDPFKEPVTVKVNGLPAGLKADPATVAPNASDFTVKVVADAKAAPATANANVTLAFQVNKKDYPPQTIPLAVKVLPAK